MKRLYVPTRDAEDWKPLLAEPCKQWQTGFSARTLAYCWEAAEGIPDEVVELFTNSSEFPNDPPELLFAIPEHQVPLPGGRTASQNDVFALLKCHERVIAMTVEGKVDERFGPIMGDWFAEASDGKRERLSFIKSKLGLTGDIPPEIHYQLLHRSASAVIEAGRFNADAAVMVVHSFSPERKWFDAYLRFLALFEIHNHTLALFEIHNHTMDLVKVSTIGGLDFYCGWACGDQRFLEA